ncbi:hypothetical protein [Xanthocytophaga flava]|uniref:hypothetical protein n=1 Tax=Xanthocytophaga flava TaxID=3048013 RepID=UPI0028D0958A|nr:hypothetical protein [Xanthocytophaga flavus]MDJ1473715.1 hypothetical protein [Xanthocytophaga flavus]
MFYEKRIIQKPKAAGLVTRSLQEDNKGIEKVKKRSFSKTFISGKDMEQDKGLACGGEDRRKVPFFAHAQIWLTKLSFGALFFGQAKNEGACGRGMKGTINQAKERDLLKINQYLCSFQTNRNLCYTFLIVC